MGGHRDEEKVKREDPPTRDPQSKAATGMRGNSGVGREREPPLTSTEEVRVWKLGSLQHRGKKRNLISLLGLEESPKSSNLIFHV